MGKKINIHHAINNLGLSTLSFLGVILVFIIGNQLYISKDIIGIDKGLYYFLLFLIILAVNMIGIRIITYFGESDDRTTIKENDIIPLESELLPVYLGLFIIALELNGGLIIENIGLMLFVFLFWLFIGKNTYFNPFLLILGYSFYKVKTEGNKNITLMIKRSDIKEATELKGLIRVNNFTFLKK